MQAFNDPTSDVNVFVTSLALASYGLNFHRCCARGLVLQFPWNANAVLQAFGRLVRVGQKEQVQWTILRVADTFHDWQEERICAKFVEQVRAESSIPEWVASTELRTICAYELVRYLFGQPWNRYA